MEERYRKLKIEKVVNRILYAEGIIDEKKYKQVSKRLDKLLYEESKRRLDSTLT